MQPSNQSTGTNPQPRVIIIGAGMSGLAMGINLLKSGNSNFRIYEKAERCGGTRGHQTGGSGADDKQVVGLARLRITPIGWPTVETKLVVFSTNVRKLLRGVGLKHRTRAYSQPPLNPARRRPAAIRRSAASYTTSRTTFRRRKC